MLEQTTTGKIEVFRAVLDCDALTASDARAEFGKEDWATWTPSRDCAEQDARNLTDDDAEHAWLQVGWICAGDLELDDDGYLTAEDLIEEGGLLPVAGWFDDADRQALDVLWEVLVEDGASWADGSWGERADRVETVRNALLTRAVARAR